MLDKVYAELVISLFLGKLSKRNMVFFHSQYVF